MCIYACVCLCLWVCACVKMCVLLGKLRQDCSCEWILARDSNCRTRENLTSLGPRVAHSLPSSGRRDYLPGQNGSIAGERGTLKYVLGKSSPEQCLEYQFQSSQLGGLTAQNMSSSVQCPAVLNTGCLPLISREGTLTSNHLPLNTNFSEEGRHQGY